MNTSKNKAVACDAWALMTETVTAVWDPNDSSGIRVTDPTRGIPFCLLLNIWYFQSFACKTQSVISRSMKG